MELPTLKPCPFCDGRSIKSRYVRDGRQMFCQSCGTAAAAAYQGPNNDTMERAIAAWNTRSTPAPEPANAIWQWRTAGDWYTVPNTILDAEKYAMSLAREFGGEVRRLYTAAELPRMAGELREARQGRDAAVIANADLAQISIEYRKKMSAAVAESGELAAEVERLTKERDEARAGRKLMSSQGSDTGLMFMGAQAERDAAEAALSAATAEIERLRKIVAGFVSCIDSFDQTTRNHADGYYAFVKGKHDLWTEARAALAEPVKKPGETIDLEGVIK